MKPVYIPTLLVLTLAIFSSASHAASMLRIACEGADTGAEIYVNGKFKGECPIDVAVPEGMVKLRVQKSADAEHNRVFEQEIRMGDGAVKKVEAHLGAAELNAEGRKRKEEKRKACPSCYPEMVAILGRNYEMGKYEVTQKQWQNIMGSNPSNFKACGENCPVENVSWNDVQEFIRKFNDETGLQYRLPTEAEWEYACYGGNQTEYCGSNDVNAVAWYGDNSGTHQVGQKHANAFGLYDMSGNVWEWQQDKYDNEHDWRVLRGGSWLFDALLTRAAFRNRSEPTTRNFSYGFRLARTLP